MGGCLSSIMDAQVDDELYSGIFLSIVVGFVWELSFYP